MKSTIKEKHPNSKFCHGSKAHAERFAKLQLILARMFAGKSFSDLQVARLPQGIECGIIKMKGIDFSSGPLRST